MLAGAITNTQQQRALYWLRIDVKDVVFGKILLKSSFPKAI